MQLVGSGPATTGVEMVVALPVAKEEAPDKVVEDHDGVMSKRVF